MATAVGHVVVFVQENHTTDNYFSSMRAWGADVATGWPVQPNPPTKLRAWQARPVAPGCRVRADEAGRGCLGFKAQRARLR